MFFFFFLRVTTASNEQSMCTEKVETGKATFDIITFSLNNLNCI